MHCRSKHFWMVSNAPSDRALQTTIRTAVYQRKQLEIYSEVVQAAKMVMENPP